MSAYPFVSMSDKQCQRGTDDIPIPCRDHPLSGAIPYRYLPLAGIIPCRGGAVILLGRVSQKPYE